MLQTLSHSEKTLARSYSNYLAQINIELTQASNRTNDTAHRLTVLATFLVPMNLVTGSYLDMAAQISDFFTFYTIVY
jgi:magnesium transporter